MTHDNLTDGFRTDPNGGAAAPPFTQPRYKFDSVMTFNKNVRMQPGRYNLESYFNKLPGINADTTFIKSTNFELLGTNAVSSVAAHATTDAGILLTSTTADNDQVFVLPYISTGGYTAWSGVLWGTENQVIWEASFKTGVITTMLIFAGLKLTNDPTVATDDDQVYFRYSTDDTDTTWEVVYSIGGTDVTVDSGVTVVASTQYNFRIEIDDARKAHFYINNAQVAVSAALTDDVDLIPYIGFQNLGATAHLLTLNYQKISRMLFE